MGKSLTIRVGTGRIFKRSDIFIKERCNQDDKRKSC